MRSPLPLLLLLPLTLTAHAADLRVVEALRAETPIVVDGDLSEPCWHVGLWHSEFTVLNLPDRPAPVQTRFKIRHDDQNLYFGVELDEPRPEAMKTDATERDGKVHSDDCVEVMVDPTGERIEYYHFIVNSLGVVYDAELRQGGHVRSVEWDADVEAAARVGAQGWTVELRIPVVELGLTAASKGDWAVNVTRERRVEGEELSTFAPMTGGFHQPSLYAVLRLPDADFSRFLWEIKPPYEERVRPDAAGRLTYSAKTHVRNAGPAFRFIMLRGRLEGAEGEWVRDGLDAGQAREYELSVPVAEQGPQNLVLELVDRRDPAVALAVKTIPTEITYSPLTLTLIRPWYRDSIYATETIAEILCEVTAAAPDEELAGLRLAADLALQGEGNPAIARAEQPAAAHATIRMAIPEDLPVGDYDLRVRLVDAAGEARHSATKRVRKLPRVEHEWRIDERNVLRYNGEPVLPFGWFSIPASAMAEPGHAYTAMQAYNSQYYSNERVREELDAVAAAGTAVAIYPYPTPRMLDTAAWGRPLSDDEAEALRLRIRALKDHPGILAWYMADEPELRPALPERCRRIYEIVADEDPFHPCIMLNDTIAGIYKYPDGGDILMPDPYPLFLKDGLAAQPLEKTSKFIQAAVDAGKGRRAVWATPQAFNYGDYGRKNNRAPNLTELRNQLYQAVVYGARGFLWYTWSHTANYPHLGLGMPWLSFEVADLKDAILADPADGVTVTVEADQPEHIHVSARRVDDDLFIFAVSTATVPQDARLTINPAPGMRSLYVVSEGRNAPLRDGVTIEDRFDIYETHIYTTDAQAGGRANIAQVLAEIEQADAARHKPGNLAFEDNGTVVEVSSRSTYGSTPERVIDGVETGMRWQAEARSLPQWLVVRWPEPVALRRAVVFGPTLADFEAQALEGEEWVTVGRVAGNTEPRVEVVFDRQVQTTALRIFITGLVEGADQARIWEVEAYAD